MTQLKCSYEQNPTSEVNSFSLTVKAKSLRPSVDECYIDQEARNKTQIPDPKHRSFLLSQEKIVPECRIHYRFTIKLQTKTFSTVACVCFYLHTFDCKMVLR